MAYTYIGVDLSKDWLDIYHPETGPDRVANRAPAIRAWLARLAPTELVVFEATSLCDGVILRCLDARRHVFHRLNPGHAWHFARSLNLPKTDRVDAKMLARLGAERSLPPSPAFEAARAELAELSGRHDQLKRMETQEKNRLKKTFSAAVRADIRDQLRGLARRIARIEAAIDTFLKDHPDLAAPLRLIESIPGVGRVTAVVLVALMPELGACDRRQIASLGGVAPRARESGKWRGRRFVGDGRRRVRQALYMAALSVIRSGHIAPDLVARMRAEARPGKVIAIAIARKLLTIANAVLRDGVPFREIAPPNPT
ncbi:IS110 family transposase [Psychromarinibacter sp. C21-152]|uniref:IS110 family transposase n=1 Tax=Psychromarinibacter sediminicola TaxID=3033385 RepID=A0AAE3NYF1_9RHOB|nr:IS110 family transposase [Psychromarinibacter sediminicola]MDF0603959.1 IS110 family transposase [Psychromarinibacter sediminicola]